MQRDEKDYRGESITVRFDRRRCIHASACLRLLPAVFNVRRRPWIEPDAAPVDEVAEAVLRCPTGALHFERRDGRGAETAPEVNSVTVAEWGPLYVHGDVEVVDHEGNVLLRDTRVGLCRCGASGNRPLCDDAHFGVGFDDSGSVAQVGPTPGASGTGPLRVRVVKSGPLVVEGSFLLVGADGQKVPVADLAVCRCGASRAKPLCDGSHRSGAFQE
ncbi:MAG: CDGSH iron-sulfur domain-containing protein [Thermoanaerobaculaceae bacterium]|jgi:uncharacterized Fe-S cluster protein YjdI/CDGSH-type Zn-finger protein|nr:CDGSH iron-sulfur domain-containing protein [Thermoanaerobaculaceae bacterium]